MLSDVRRVDRDGWAVVVITGDLDLATIPTARAGIDRCEGAQVALDLSGVAHLDPVALGVVVAASLRVGRRGGRFAVVATPGRSRDLLAESGLDRIITVVGSTGELATSGPSG